MTFQWIPDPKILEADRAELRRHIGSNRLRLETRAQDDGLTQGVWVSDVMYCHLTSEKFHVWLDDAGIVYQTYWSIVGDEWFVAFQEKRDLILFTLRWLP